MSTDTNKALVRRFHEEVLRQRKMEVVDELFADNLIDHSAPPGLAPGKEGLKQLFTLYQRAFPDFSVTLEDMVAEGDLVTTRVTWHGTHQGELMGIPATGKQVAFGGMDLYRVEGGKIVEMWDSADQLGMMQQLGVIPPQG